MGTILPPGDIWQHLETSFILTPQWEERGDGTCYWHLLLNIHRITPQDKNVHSANVEKPWFKETNFPFVHEQLPPMAQERRIRHSRNKRLRLAVSLAISGLGTDGLHIPGSTHCTDLSHAEHHPFFTDQSHATTSTRTLPSHGLRIIRWALLDLRPCICNV